MAGAEERKLKSPIPFLSNVNESILPLRRSDMSEPKSACARQGQASQSKSSFNIIPNSSISSSSNCLHEVSKQVPTKTNPWHSRNAYNCPSRYRCQPSRMLTPRLSVQGMPKTADNDYIVHVHDINTAQDDQNQKQLHELRNPCSSTSSSTNMHNQKSVGSKKPSKVHSILEVKGQYIS